MTPRASFVLSVSDLAAERAFYRDVIGLGDPVMNSNVWVEFKLDGASFCLEQAASSKAPLPPHGRTEFLFFIDSLEEFEKRYRSFGAATASAEGVPCEQMGVRAIQYPDPEGNLFRVTDRRHR
jgi:catechol 2,3-dioxygenase-like lactoylglutathione lyase family enzyme